MKLLEVITEKVVFISAASANKLLYGHVVLPLFIMETVAKDDILGKDPLIQWLVYSTFVIVGWWRCGI